MPKIWSGTIDEHRRAVHDAVLDAAAALVAEHGLTGVTMSAIATGTGIGRATLYKYFPDIDAVLTAWHERQVAQHLALLSEAAARTATPLGRLRAVLTAYTELRRGHDGGGDLAAMLHGSPHVTAAHAHLQAFLRELIAAAVAAGEIRTEPAAADLAAFCLAALDHLPPSRPAALRRVELVLAALTAKAKGGSRRP
jgi:AcrR family transcriptional regulator